MGTSAEEADRLSGALFGKTRRRLLGWLFTHPDEAFYVRELMRIAGEQGAVPRELETLTTAGILLRTVRGKQVFYQANEACPIFGELKGIFLKTAGLVDELRRALALLASRIRVALVHGSSARGTLRAGSDIDLVVIGEVSFGEVVSALSPAQARLGREVNPVVYTTVEFRAKVRSGHHFVTSFLREPHFFVVGGPGELERLGAKGLASGASLVPPGDHRSAVRRRARPRR